ncbi:hypothetical protein Hanom_Chr08g00703791 [Helianthus anomalus]
MVFCGGDFAFRSADHSVCMFDRRNLTSDGVGSPVHKFEEHKAPVLCVQVLLFYLYSLFIYIFFVNLHALF